MFIHSGFPHCGSINSTAELRPRCAFTLSAAGEVKQHREQEGKDKVLRSLITHTRNVGAHAGPTTPRFPAPVSRDADRLFAMPGGRERGEGRGLEAATGPTWRGGGGAMLEQHREMDENLEVSFIQALGSPLGGGGEWGSGHGSLSYSADPAAVQLDGALNSSSRLPRPLPGHGHSVRESC
ncbi:unnamed protein product [Arctogadus glacialis]